jgi:hypothetical protein
VRAGATLGVQAEPPGLEAYLSELSSLLPSANRRRAVAEIRDHVLSEVESRLADGHAEPEAVAAALSCVGDARRVAAGFAHDRARRAVTRSESVTLACVLVFGALFVLSTQVTGVAGRSAFTQGAPGAVGWIASQIAVAAGVIAWLRGRWMRRIGRTSAGEQASAGHATSAGDGTSAGDATSADALALLLRAAVVAVGSVTVAVVLDALAVLGSSARTSGALGTGLAVAASAAVAAACSLVWAAGCVFRLHRLDRHGGEGGGASALEVLRWATLDAAEVAAARCERYPGGIRAATAIAAAIDRTLRWTLRGRARTAVAAGAFAGAALAATSLHEHGLGGGGRHALPALAAGAVVFAVEASAVIVAVYLFDRVLRLWPPGGRRDRQVTG